MLAEAEVEEAEPLEAENEGDDDDNDENPDVLYEANVMKDQRMLDDDDVKVLGSKSKGKTNTQLKVLNPFVCIGEGDNQWQIQRAHRLKRKLKRTMIHELRKKDVMPNDRAKMVRKVKGAQSRFAHIEKFSLKFSNSSFVIRVNLLHP